MYDSALREARHFLVVRKVPPTIHRHTPPGTSPFRRSVWQTYQLVEQRCWEHWHELHRGTPPPPPHRELRCSTQTPEEEEEEEEEEEDETIGSPTRCRISRLSGCTLACARHKVAF